MLSDFDSREKRWLAAFALAILITPPLAIFGAERIEAYYWPTWHEAPQAVLAGRYHDEPTAIERWLGYRCECSPLDRVSGLNTPVHKVGTK